jgi:hypothetical protein
MKIVQNLKKKLFKEISNNICEYYIKNLKIIENTLFKNLKKFVKKIVNFF